MSEGFSMPSAQSRGLSRGAIFNMGLLFVAIGMVGTAILENRVLHLSVGGQLLAAMERPGGFAAATAAIACRGLYLCAVPLFAFLLVEAFAQDSNFLGGLLEVLGVAVVSELPYNLAISGKLLDLSSRNPVFALAVALVMLRLFQEFPGRSGGSYGMKAIVILAAFCWCAMVGIDQGDSLLFMTLVLWPLRNRPAARGLAGSAGAFACCLFSPYYIVSPMSALALHLDSGEEGTQSKLWRLAAYPGLLAIIGFGALL